MTTCNICSSTISKKWYRYLKGTYSKPWHNNFIEEKTCPPRTICHRCYLQDAKTKKPTRSLKSKIEKSDYENAICNICNTGQSSRWSPYLLNESDKPQIVCKSCYMKDYHKKRCRTPEIEQMIRKNAAERAKKWREEHPEMIKSNYLIQARKLTTRFKISKKTALKKKKDWLLTFEEFCNFISQPCYYCSNKLCKPTEIGSGLDRLDNTKGYIYDNVVSCCKVCNSCKLNIFSPEEMKQIANLIIKMRGL